MAVRDFLEWTRKPGGKEDHLDVSVCSSALV